MSRLYDVAVVGAGPGGSAAAYYLGRMGLQVLLLDKAIFPRDKICGDALTPRGVVMLDAIGLLAQVAAVGQRVDNYQLFGPGRAYLSSSLATASNRPAYALVVPRLQLDNLLWQHAIAQGVEFENAKALNITATPRYAVVEAEQNGRKVSWQARIVIVATGASYKLLQNSQLLKQPPHMMRAARTYYENLTAPAALQMYFRSVTLPGYGWVFPVGPHCVNIGVGLSASRSSPPLHPAFDRFVTSPALQAMTNGGLQVGPLKGFPLRTDFVTAATYGERVLMVGEAAGLVNPLTGDGIDYALTSAKLAADYLQPLFEHGGFSKNNLAGYDQILRQSFQKSFIWSGRIHDWLLRPWLLDHLIKGANRYPSFKHRLMHLILG